MLYVPPVNFGMVEEGIYRSGEPQQVNFPFLERIGLKTVVCLAPDEPTAQFLNFVDDQAIALIHLGREGAKTPWKPVTEKTVVAALDVMLDATRYPLLVMCHLGRHRTGTVVGCLRKVQRWNINSILAEYRRYAGSKVRLMNEQFIELFDTDLVRTQPQRAATATDDTAVAAAAVTATTTTTTTTTAAAAPSAPDGSATTT